MEGSKFIMLHQILKLKIEVSEVKINNGAWLHLVVFVNNAILMISATFGSLATLIIGFIDTELAC